MTEVRQAGVSGKLPVPVRYGYSLGNFGKSLQNSSVDLLYLFYLIYYLGAPPELAGGALCAATIADCVTGLAIGYFVDRRGTAGLGYRTLMVFGSVASAMTFPAMFLGPLIIPSFRFACAIGLFLVFRLGSNFLDVPHNTMLAALTRNARERGKLSTLRFFFSSAGNLAVSGLIALFLPRQAGGIGGLVSYVAAVTSLFIISMSTCILTIGPVAKSAPPQAASLPSLLHALQSIGRNARFVRVVLLCMLAGCMITIFPRMALFYAQGFLGDASKASILVSAQIAGQIVSLPLWSRLQDRLTKQNVALLGYGGFAILMVVFFLLTPSSPLIAAALFFLAGVGLCGLTVMNWAMAPDTIEHTERISGERHEALTFGLLITAIKISTGAGAALLGFSLTASGYRSSPGIGDIRLPGIVVAMTALPLAGAMASMVILTRLQLKSSNPDEALSP